MKFRLQTNRLAPLSPKLHTWYDDTSSRRTTPAHLEENLIVSLPKAYLALAVPCLRSIFAAWTGVVNLCLSICKKRRHIPYSCKLRLLQADIVFQAHTKETHTNKRLAKRMLSRQSRVWPAKAHPSNIIANCYSPKKKK
ncbi:hypothetical protein T06_3669 [Trichinella sp. T6]|nr:hypothetical protein T06_3669 [Trichinella sp. T6]